MSAQLPAKGKTGTLRGMLRSKPTRPAADALATMRVCTACRLYLALAATVKSVRAEVISSLAFLPELVSRLWRLLWHMGPKGEMEIFLRAAPAPGRLLLRASPVVHTPGSKGEFAAI